MEGGRMLSDVVFVALVSLFVYLGRITWRHIRTLLRLPPGPRGLPLLGAALKFDPAHAIRTLQQWKEEFGDIFSFTLPGQSVVVVSGYELIREALVTRSDEFAGRPESFRLNALQHFYSDGMGYSCDSPHNRMIRKTAITALKMYGEQLQRLEDIALRALDDMIAEWRGTEGKPFDPQSSINTVVTKVMTSLVYGEWMTEAQMEEHRILQAEFREIANPGGLGQILELMPWLRFFGNDTWNLIVKSRNKSYRLFTKLTEDCKARFDGENPECSYHSLLLTQKLMRQHQQGKSGRVLSDKDIYHQGWGMIVAGSGTTFMSLYAFIAVMTNHPSLQKRLQDEVDRAVGVDKPKLTDKPKMPLIEATVHELLRYGTQVPILLPHSTMKDTTLGGYSLPKGTQVWFNVFGLNHDPRHWEQPWEFRPERFLDENGQVVKADHENRRRALGFGAGRLACIGEVLARNRLFLIVACMMQNFHFFPKSEAERPEHDPRTYTENLGLIPKDYQICVLPRKDVF